MHEARLPTTPHHASVLLRLIGATLIDGTGNAPIVSSEIVVEGERISYVGPLREGLPADPRATTIDLTGLTVLPGFIDTHVHMTMRLETPHVEGFAQFTSQRVLNAAGSIHDTLMAGITAARDLAGLDAGYRRAIADGTILGPRLHLAVAALSPTGGHVDLHLPNGECLVPHMRDFAMTVDSDDDLRRAVRTLIRSEADVIKICTTGGVSSPSDTPTDLGVPEHQVRIAVKETNRRNGQPVAAHAQGAAGILEALRGGITSIEHGYEIDDEGIELMLAQGAFLVPTLSSALRVPDPANVPEYLYEKKVRWSAIAREHISKAIRAGVKVAMGTDAGVCPHGENLKELGYMVELGMSPMDAILAGTKNAAELMRLDGHLGTVQAGKLADLIITEIDPLTDITSLAKPANIGAIIQGGRTVKDLKGWLHTAPTQALLSHR